MGETPDDSYFDEEDEEDSDCAILIRSSVCGYDGWINKESLGIFSLLGLRNLSTNNQSL